MVHIFRTCTIILKAGTHKKNVGHSGTNIKQLIMNTLISKPIATLNQDTMFG